MERKKRQEKLRRSGFTLVELIVVMAILAILLAIAVPQMMNYIKAAHRATASTEAQIAADAIQRYLNDQKEEGELDGGKVWKLMNLDLNDPDGVLKDYVTGGQKNARIVSVNVEVETGLLKNLVYETQYGRVKLTIDDLGNRELTEEFMN